LQRRKARRRGGSAWHRPLLRRWRVAHCSPLPTARSPLFVLRCVRQGRTISWCGGAGQVAGVRWTYAHHAHTTHAAAHRAPPHAHYCDTSPHCGAHCAARHAAAGAPGRGAAATRKRHTNFFFFFFLLLGAVAGDRQAADSEHGKRTDCGSWFAGSSFYAKLSRALPSLAACAHLYAPGIGDQAAATPNGRAARGAACLRTGALKFSGSAASRCTHPLRAQQTRLFRRGGAKQRHSAWRRASAGDARWRWQRRRDSS